jgi:S-DNA-T family DNA segregation ATPase FtsK/SpoIIIE
MAKQSSKKSAKGSSSNRLILGLLLILIALLAIGGMLGKAGSGGYFIARASYLLFGAGKILLPVGLGIVGVMLILKRPFVFKLKETITGAVGIFSLLAFLSIWNVSLGGWFGKMIGLLVTNAFDKTFAGIILAFVTVGSFALFFEGLLSDIQILPNFFANISDSFRNFFQRLMFWKKSDDDIEIEEEEEVDEDEEDVEEEEEDDEDEPVPEVKKEKDLKVTDGSQSELVMDTKKKHGFTGVYTPPPLSLLENDRGKANVGDVKANANIIRRTLLNFGIEVEMDEVTIGPTVTRYALKPAQGVKLSKIVGLQNDLALALAAHPIRIEAPIPGKSLVGIELPNKTKATVGLGTLLADQMFAQGKPLTVALGRSIAGKAVMKSVAKMPHLLIAGTTGSGKSVTIHSIITSLLYRHGPEELRMIFVDPKRVELTLYNGIPHLLTPVITDSKKAILALKWAATEMNRRYDVLESESVRDIESYHKKYSKEFSKPRTGEDDEQDRMPFIVVIIDELADIMQAYPREMEAAIVRLAQMSRAVGIHLILSTQRPEVNVITGLIKANVPARIALRVPTQIDSRTILDSAGAEKLLGQGDMLAVIGENQAERLQSAYITEEEVKDVVKYLKGAFKDELPDTIELSGTVTGEKSMFSDSMEEGDDDDALYEDARAAVVEAGKASTSYIQRKLRVGYARAARLMDMLEERGVIGPADGAKPREVLDDGNIKTSTVEEVAKDMGL